MNILNLDAFDVLAADELDGQYHVSVQSKQLPCADPQCDCLHEPYRFGGREREFFDFPMHGRRIVSHVFIQRLRCRNCGVTFYDVHLTSVISAVRLIRAALWGHFNTLSAISVGRI